MAKAPRVLQWAAMALLVLLAARVAWELALDVLGWIVVDEVIAYAAPGVGWTAFQRCIVYRWIPGTDTSLFLSRDIDDEALWHRIAPTDTHLLGPMTWVTATHLRIPARYRNGCLRSLEDVVIEWSTQ